MAVNPENSKSNELQGSKEEEYYYYWFTTIYPFSLKRLMALVLISLALPGSLLWAWITLIRFYRQPMEVRLQKLASMLGPGFASEGILIVVAILMLVATVLVVLTIFIYVPPRIKRTLVLTAWKEGIDIADNLLLFLSRKKHIPISDVASAAVTRDGEGRWIEVTMTRGGSVRLPIRSTLDDEEEEENAQSLASMINDHRTRYIRINQSEDSASWKKKLARYLNKDEFDEMDHDEKYAMIRSILEDIAAEYESTKIITRDDLDEKANVTGERFELRMKRNGTPVRVIMGGHGQPIIEVKPGLRKGSFCLYQDEELIPKERDTADPWSESDEQIVFVAKGVYTTDDDMGSVKETLAALEVLPPQVMDDLLAGMEMQCCNLFYLLGDSDRIEADMIGIYIMEDPLKEIRDMIDFIAGIASRIGSGVLNIPEGGMKKFEFTRCDYCGSRYTFGLRQQCPNCGSPPK